jgi:L-alanine-DL-glutamate epimerase-like enolase superfamily enzyme
MRMHLHHRRLPLRRPFRIAHGTTTTYEAILVELSHEGESGWGEAGANAYYGVTHAGLEAALESARPIIEAVPPDSSDPSWLDRLWEDCGSVLGADPFARSAVDCAAWDLHGRMAGVPLWRLFAPEAPAGEAARVHSSYTLGLDRPEIVLAKLAEMPGWPIYKLKLGGDDDLAIVRAIRGVTDVPLRVDANCGWSVATALAMADELARLGVELIEQPLPAGDRTGMTRVRAGSQMPLFADEDCVGPADVAACTGLFDGVNIKLVKCGGLTPARRMIAAARDCGLSVMIGCMTESTVGIAAAAQLLPLVDVADLDGAVLLAADTAAGVAVDRGVVQLSAEPGLGIRVQAGSLRGSMEAD